MGEGPDLSFFIPFLLNKGVDTYRLYFKLSAKIIATQPLKLRNKKDIKFCLLIDSMWHKPDAIA